MTPVSGVVPETTGGATPDAVVMSVSSDADVDAAARSEHAAIGSSATAAGMVSSSLIISRWALRPVSLPLFWPEEDWSRRLNCRPPLPVLKPASSSARCNWGASCRSIDSVSGFSTVKCEVTWPLRSTSMRTSMRPRSAGSSRISKLLLPLLTDAAISSASPLNGTAALRRRRDGQRAAGAAVVARR